MKAYQVKQEDLNRIGENVNIVASDAAAREEQQKQYDPFEGQRAKNSFDQQEKLKKIFHKCALGILILLAVCLGIILVSRLGLIILPTSRRWLNKDEIGEIDHVISYIVVGSVGSFVLKYYQNNIK